MSIVSRLLGARFAVGGVAILALVTVVSPQPASQSTQSALITTLEAPPSPMTATALSTPSTPWVGLIAPTSAQLNAISGSKISRVTVSAAWDLIEPSHNVYSTTAGNVLAAEIGSLRSRGLQVVLDLGLQYPPAWVFALPGPTRFVDQFGDQWHGTTSEDSPNLVFNNNVRLAAAAYIAHVAAVVGVGNVASIRVGGLLSGELRYPPNVYNGHSDLIWDYDTVAQFYAPVKGWKPGLGTATQTTSALTYYYNSLAGFETWLMRTVAAHFPTVNQQVMFPSWGIRPGQTQAAATSGMKNQTLAEKNGTISAGLDWPTQVKAMATTGLNATVYTTWLDAPSQGTSVTQVPPVDYLASLAATYGLPVAGENTGRGGATALAESMDRVQKDHLVGMMYMCGPFIVDGTAGITIQNLMTVAAQAS